jgi:hypothetical protein
MMFVKMQYSPLQPVYPLLFGKCKALVMKYLFLRVAILLFFFESKLLLTLALREPLYKANNP